MRIGGSSPKQLILSVVFILIAFVVSTSVLFTIDRIKEPIPIASVAWDNAANINVRIMTSSTSSSARR
jgi:hypothetical protein